MFVIKNLIYIKKLKFIIENVLNNVFMIYTFYKKNAIIFSIKRLVFKNFILSIKFFFLNAIQKINLLYN